MNLKQKIEAAQQRVESSAMREALDTLRSIVERLRIPHTKYVRTPGAVQVHWNPMSTKMPAKMAGYLMSKLGFQPAAGDVKPPFREFTNGTYSVLVGTDFGTIALRPLSKEPLTASTVTASDDFDEYDDYDQWLADVKQQWPKARHNKPGAPGYKQGYGEPEDEEFLIGPDMQSDIVGVWMANDGFGWIMRNPKAVKSSAGNRDADDLFNVAWNELSANYNPHKPWNDETTLDYFLSYLENDPDYKKVFLNANQAKSKAKAWLKNPPFRLD